MPPPKSFVAFLALMALMALTTWITCRVPLAYCCSYSWLPTPSSSLFTNASFTNKAITDSRRLTDYFSTIHLGLFGLLFGCGMWVAIALADNIRRFSTTTTKR
jgi:hypothetical protein